MEEQPDNIDAPKTNRISAFVLQRFCVISIMRSPKFIHLSTSYAHTVPELVIK